MPMFSTDGRFDAAALKKLSESFVAPKMLDHTVDLAPYVTEKFLPERTAGKG
jgi:hypothetical protein